MQGIADQLFMRENNIIVNLNYFNKILTQIVGKFLLNNQLIKLNLILKVFSRNKKNQNNLKIMKIHLPIIINFLTKDHF